MCLRNISWTVHLRVDQFSFNSNQLSRLFTNVTLNKLIYSFCDSKICLSFKFCYMFGKRRNLTKIRTTVRFHSYYLFEILLMFKSYKIKTCDWLFLHSFEQMICCFSLGVLVLVRAITEKLYCFYFSRSTLFEKLSEC